MSVAQVGSIVPGGLKGPHELLVFSASVEGYENEMSLLIDSGASQNFVSRAALASKPHRLDRLVRIGKRENVLVRLANGSTVHSEGSIVTLSLSFCDFVCKEEFIV